MHLLLYFSNSSMCSDFSNESICLFTGLPDLRHLPGFRAREQKHLAMHRGPGYINKTQEKLRPHPAAVYNNSNMYTSLVPITEVSGNNIIRMS